MDKINMIQGLRLKTQNSKATQKLKVCDILGTKVHNVSLGEVLGRAEKFLCGGSQHYIVTPNPEIVLYAQKNPRYRRVLNRASFSLPDGTGIIWASKKLYGSRRITERVTGIDFLLAFLRRLSQKSVPWEETRRKRVVLIGAKSQVARKAAESLQVQFPNVGFYALSRERSRHLKFIINEIIKPDCIFVALGAPKQEFWIKRNLPKMPSVKLAMGVGGAFDFVAGSVPRAPVFMQKMGLEWLWRLAVQPWRLPRIILATVVFPLTILFYRKK